MKRILILILLMGLMPLISRSQNNLDYLKKATDAMSFETALYMLTYKGSNPRIKEYKNRLDLILDDLSAQNAGFSKYGFPIELRVTTSNKAKIDEIFVDLAILTQEIKELVNLAKNQFDIKDLQPLLILTSENPGDYYNAINPGFMYNLNTHPYKDRIEFMQLQDIGFEEVMAGGDSTLWNIGIHCPELKILTLFGAEITTETLSEMNLNTIKKLQFLELSQNKIASLPTNFNANNTIEYLGLERNKLTKLPKNIQLWTNLKYLDIRNNQFSTEEKQRIIDALPNTKINF